MKRYRLLKDYPGYKAGNILCKRENRLMHEYYQFDENSPLIKEDYLKKYPDWFEEVKEEGSK